MNDPAALLRLARNRAGMTQAQLAERLHTSQAAVARLERTGSNPTVATLRRTLAATDHGLELRAPARSSAVDMAQLLRHMKMSPAERLDAHQKAYDNTRALLAETGRLG